MNCEERHEYAEKHCTSCGAIYCWACCGATNVHEGGKHTPDYMTCPKCNKDYYEAASLPRKAK